MTLLTARGRFAAALALYAAWVGTLVVLAGISSSRPPQGPVLDGPIQARPMLKAEPSPTGADRH